MYSDQLIFPWNVINERQRVDSLSVDSMEEFQATMLDKIESIGINAFKKCLSFI